MANDLELFCGSPEYEDQAMENDDSLEMNNPTNTPTVRHNLVVRNPNNITTPLHLPLNNTPTTVSVPSQSVGLPALGINQLSLRNYTLSRSLFGMSDEMLGKHNQPPSFPITRFQTDPLFSPAQLNIVQQVTQLPQANTSPHAPPNENQHPTTCAPPISTPTHEEFDAIRRSRLKGKKPLLDNVPKAEWTPIRHEIFLRLCLDEVRKGNVHNNSLSKDGMTNLIAKFEKETSLLLGYKQFRNHWDKTRGKWGLFRRLSMVTGLGWNDETETFTMDSERWEDTIKKFPEAKEFREGPPKYLEMMDEIFRGKCAVGMLSFQTQSSVGSSSFMSSSPSTTMNITDTSDSGARPHGHEVEDIFSPPKKRARPNRPPSPPRLPEEVTDALAQIKIALLLRNAKDNGKTEVDDDDEDYRYCISLLEETEYEERSDLYAFGASILLEKKYRLLFKTLKSVGAREHWLNYEFMKSN